MPREGWPAAVAGLSCCFHIQYLVWLILDKRKNIHDFFQLLSTAMKAQVILLSGCSVLKSCRPISWIHIVTRYLDTIS